jgi:hypothetical protein
MLVVLSIFLLLLYFWPAIIAKGRRHNNTTAIFATNLLLGWTLLGWVASFIWALTADVKPAGPRRPKGNPIWIMIPFAIVILAVVWILMG